MTLRWEVKELYLEEEKEIKNPAKNVVSIRTAKASKEAIVPRK